MSEPLLHVSGLSSGYAGAAVLHQLDVQLQRGQVLALLGRNGMGKTTLLKTLMRMLALQQGRICFAGADLAQTPSFVAARSGLAYVPEGRGIFADLSVKENLLLAARAPHDAHHPAWTLQRLLELFPRLQQRLHHLGGQLSGGEQQMAAIARALLTQPRLLMIDEATEGLAPAVAQEIWGLLARLKSENMALIVVDKNWRPLLQLADRALVLVKGSAVFNGDAKLLLAQPNLLQRHLGV